MSSNSSGFLKVENLLKKFAETQFNITHITKIYNFWIFNNENQNSDTADKRSEGIVKPEFNECLIGTFEVQLKSYARTKIKHRWKERLDRIQT